MCGDNRVWGVSNAGYSDLTVWLEPWAEEYAIPTNSTFILKIIGTDLSDEFVDVDDNEGRIIIWAQGGQKIEIYIDGVPQKSASSMIAVPEISGLSTKDFLAVAFGQSPEARLGGQEYSAKAPLSRWQKLRHLIGI